jgi:glycosyltransferase involved in cell wall biosynthesis
MNSWLVSPVLVAHRLGVPYIFDLGDYWLSEALALYGCEDWRRRLYRRFMLGGRLQRSIVRKAFVHSEFMHRHHVEIGVDCSALEYVPRGVDESLVNAKPKANRNAAPVRIACVGRLVPDKGALLLIEAFAQLVERNRHVELCFYGDGDDEYCRQVADLSRMYGLLNAGITLHGPIAWEAMPSVYAEVDIVAVPVLWDEPSSNVLLEAMATSTPVVATAAGSNAEFVEDGVTGFVVPRSPKRFAQALEELVRRPDLRRRMGSAGQRRIIQNHTLKRIYDRSEIELVNWVRECHDASNASRTMHPAAGRD